MDDIGSIGEDLNRVRASDGLEVVTSSMNLSLLRFSNSTFHQNVDTELNWVHIRSRFKNRAGNAATSNLSRDSLLKALRQSESIAKISLEDPYLPPLMKMDKREYDATVPQLLTLTPEKSAKVLKEIFKTFKNVRFYGVFFNYTEKQSLFHSTGFKLKSAFNEIQLNLLGIEDKTHNSVWIQKSLRDLNDVEVEELKNTIDWKLSFGEPGVIEPGKYTVILEPVALFDLLMYLTYIGFSGTAHVDGYSPLKDRLGEKVFSQDLTLIDDPLDENLFPIKYDFEGIPKRRTLFVDRGVFNAIAYDRKTALKAGTESTGHAATPFGGIMITHLKMKEGKNTISELIEDTEKGILITRFHYINVVDMQNLTFTGMTRDGTFLIENGKITKSLSNMRFNVSLFEVLSDENLIIGKDTQDIGMAEIYGDRVPLRYRLPCVKIKNFNFIQSEK